MKHNETLKTADTCLIKTIFYSSQLYILSSVKTNNNFVSLLSLIHESQRLIVIIFFSLLISMIPPTWNIFFSGMCFISPQKPFFQGISYLNSSLPSNLLISISITYRGLKQGIFVLHPEPFPYAPFTNTRGKIET